MSAGIRTVGPCPDWCTLSPGHSWDAVDQAAGPVMRRHVGQVFGSDRMSHVTVEADEYANETDVRPMVVVPHVEECGELDPFDADCLRQALTNAIAWIADRGFTRWWAVAPNPACRPWCQDEHDAAEFSSGGMFVCRAWVLCENVAEIEAVEINAATRVDDTPGSISLVYDAPEIDVHLVNDSDGDWWTPEGFERVATVMPSLLAQARTIAASDEHATDEQKAVAA